MSTLNFNIKNNSGIAEDQIFIGFSGSDLNATINGVPMASIEASSWYKLSEINSFVMAKKTSGRVYVAYGDTFLPTDGGGIPSIVDPHSPAYHTRFDKFELTFDGSPYGVADLTAIDFWSIPMSLATEKNGELVDSLAGVTAGSTTSELYAGLSQLSHPAQSTATGEAIVKAFESAGHALAPDVQTQLKNPVPGLITDSNNRFVRIIGANTYPPFGNPTEQQPPGLPFTPYNTFVDYFQYLINTFGPGKAAPWEFATLGNGKIAHLVGDYGGSTAGAESRFKQQSYDLWATIDNSFNLTLHGSGSVVGDIKITITKWNLLNPAATYGGNPIFSLNGDAPQSPSNNLYAWILGDFFAGINIGAIGSAATVEGKVVGEMTSTEWFSILPTSGTLFDKLWTGNITNHWNQWAQALNPRSEAYNFAYAERFSAPQLSIDPQHVDTLTLILLNADVRE